MPARRPTSGARPSPAAATSASRPWVSSPSASVCRNGSCTGAQPVVSTAGSCAQTPPRQTSVVQASPASAHASPSACGAPAMHPAASWPPSAGAQTAAVHASGGTQRLSIGTCWQPPAVQTSSVHAKPSSQLPTQSACGSVVLVGSEGSVTVVVVSGSGSVVVGSGTTMVEVVRGRVSEVVETRPRVVVGSGGSVTVVVVSGSRSVVVVGGTTMVDVVGGRVSEVVETRPRVVVGSGSVTVVVVRGSGSVVEAAVDVVTGSVTVEVVSSRVMLGTVTTASESISAPARAEAVSAAASATPRQTARRSHVHALNIACYPARAIACGADPGVSACPRLFRAADLARVVAVFVVGSAGFDVATGPDVALIADIRFLRRLAASARERLGVTEGGQSVLTLSEDFKVPDTPDPHWQVVDSKGRTSGRGGRPPRLEHGRREIDEPGPLLHDAPRRPEA